MALLWGSNIFFITLIYYDGDDYANQQNNQYPKQSSR